MRMVYEELTEDECRSRLRHKAEASIAEALTHGKGNQVWILQIDQNMLIMRSGRCHWSSKRAAMLALANHLSYIDLEYHEKLEGGDYRKEDEIRKSVLDEIKKSIEARRIW